MDISASESIKAASRLMSSSIVSFLNLLLDHALSITSATTKTVIKRIIHYQILNGFFMQKTKGMRLKKDSICEGKGQLSLSFPKRKCG